MINESQVQQLISNLIDSTSQLEPSEAKKKFSEELGTIIVNAIKSATVTVNSGIITVCGAGAGSTTSPGTGSLS
jgi:hypothetical protein